MFTVCKFCGRALRCAVAVKSCFVWIYHVDACFMYGKNYAGLPEFKFIFTAAWRLCFSTSILQLLKSKVHFWPHYAHIVHWNSIRWVQINKFYPTIGMINDNFWFVFIKSLSMSVMRKFVKPYCISQPRSDGWALMVFPPPPRFFFTPPAAQKESSNRRERESAEQMDERFIVGF